MNHPTLRLATCLLTALLATSTGALRAADDYVPGPDSQPHDGVPKGELIEFNYAGSKIFPGTTRKVTVYVPRQYDPAKPACVHVNQDGVQYNAPVVFDNLIAKGEMPVTIGVFVTPGMRLAAVPEAAQDQYNRSFEYDGLGDAYARFLLEELLPEVEKKTTADGRPIHLSHSGNDRVIAGQSSGAIAAFTAAWEHPEAFSRVISGIGTYVDLRGGGRYANLVRKYEPKPIRVFLQDGANDNNSYAGDWWMANQALERALVFSGYEVNHAWGEGTHSGKHLAAIFPDVVRWIWKGWPAPVTGTPTKNETLAALLIPGEDWQLVSEGQQKTEGPAVNAKGEVYYTDFRANKAYKIDLAGQVTERSLDPKRATGEAFGPDGRLYSVSMFEPKVLRYEADGTATVLAEIYGNDITIAHNGNIYITNPPPGGANEPGKLWLIRPNGEKVMLDTGVVRSPNGLTLTPDQTRLYVCDNISHWFYTYQIQPDGTVADRQRYGWLHEGDPDDLTYADGIRVDRDGRSYVATRLGIQVCDQLGKVQCILPVPNLRVANLVFGGEKFDILYATSGDKVYRRKLKTTGANNWDAPNKPPKPRT